MMGYYGQRSYGRAGPRMERERGVRKVLRSYDEVAKAWARQSQPEAKCRSMYFLGQIIYSYGDHFPLARFVTNDESRAAVIVNADRYSVTTSTHQREVECALRGVQWADERKFYVPTKALQQWGYPRLAHIETLRWRAAEAKDAYEKALRARQHKASWIATAKGHLDAGNDYAKFFGLLAPFALNYSGDSATKLALALGDDDAMLEIIRQASEFSPLVYLSDKHFQQLTLQGDE
jgi:hypothetical protein